MTNLCIALLLCIKLWCITFLSLNFFNFSSTFNSHFNLNLTNCEKCTWNEDFAYLWLVLLSTTNLKIARGSNGTTSALEQRQKSHPSSRLFSPILSLNPKPWSYWMRTYADQNHLNLWCPKKVVIRATTIFMSKNSSHTKSYLFILWKIELWAWKECWFSILSFGQEPIYLKTSQEQ